MYFIAFLPQQFVCMQPTSKVIRSLSSTKQGHVEDCFPFLLPFVIGKREVLRIGRSLQPKNLVIFAMESGICSFL